MKTVNLYFQVHQPWRLKVYRFFNIGKDHNYLDDFTNRAIMQKVARQCYLPMNALLLKLINENNGAFKCSFSITGSAVEQFRTYCPEVLDYAVKVDYWDVDAMADAIYGFVKYPALAKMFSTKGLEEVTGLKWNNAAAKIKDVYEDAMNDCAK